MHHMTAPFEVPQSAPAAVEQATFIRNQRSYASSWLSLSDCWPLRRTHANYALKACFGVLLLQQRLSLLNS
jgi:hypothetical protein